VAFEIYFGSFILVSEVLFQVGERGRERGRGRRREGEGEKERERREEKGREGKGREGKGREDKTKQDCISFSYFGSFVPSEPQPIG
jgi:hypothetical protein